MHVCLQKYHYTSQRVQPETILHATLGYALVYLLGVYPRENLVSIVIDNFCKRAT